MKTSSKIMMLLPILCAGCVGGPTKAYYNPAIVGAKYKGPITSALVENVDRERDNLMRVGYEVIGTCAYGGKYPEAKELITQARRVGANRVIYSAQFVPATPGSWSFQFGRGFGSGASGQGHSNVQIVFLGR